MCRVRSPYENLQLCYDGRVCSSLVCDGAALLTGDGPLFIGGSVEYPYTLIMRRIDHGHRGYSITRAEEAVIEHRTSENLDLFFRKLTDYLNNQPNAPVALEDIIINLKATNKSLMNLIRIILRKLLWAGRRCRTTEATEYVLTLADQFRKAADELMKETMEWKSD